MRINTAERIYASDVHLIFVTQPLHVRRKINTNCQGRERV
jgi:hypothetical protein